jgi:hypothetical protein
MTREERVLQRLEQLRVDAIGVRAEPWIAYPIDTTRWHFYRHSRYAYKYRLHHDEVQKWHPAIAQKSSSMVEAWRPVTGKRFAHLVKLAVLFK